MYNQDIFQKIINKNNNGEDIKNLLLADNNIVKAHFIDEKGNDTGRTPLHEAAFYGHVDLIELLINFGAEIEARDDEKRTPLHSAARGGHPECIDILLIKKANVSAIDKYGRTPLHKAVWHWRDCKDNLARYDDYTECVRLLIGKNGEIANLKDDPENPKPKVYYQFSSTPKEEAILNTQFAINDDIRKKYRSFRELFRKFFNMHHLNAFPIYDYLDERTISALCLLSKAHFSTIHGRATDSFRVKAFFEKEPPRENINALLLTLISLSFFYFDCNKESSELENRKKLQY